MANSTSKSYRRVLTEHGNGEWVVPNGQHRPADWEKAGIRVAHPDSQDSQARCLHACEAVSGATPPAIASLIENAAASFELDRNASREYLFRAFSLLRAQARRGTDKAAAMARGRLATWQLQRVIDYIEANLAGRIEAKELPGLVNLSTSHFFRAFKISVGIPPHEYITQRRIDRVLDMLRMTKVPLLQIAVDCGLRDQSHLCRVFRRVVGRSPNEWRRANTVDPRQMLHHVESSAPSAVRRLRAAPGSAEA
jgi:AraC family transcriptional regulator